MANAKMQELASRYVNRKITMAQYVTGIDRIMRGDKRELKSIINDPDGTGYYKNERDDKGGPV